MCQPATTFGDVWDILSVSRCPICHTGGSPPAGLNLSNEDTAFTQLVGVNATECSPSRARVQPGNPDASYLVNKLAGVDLCAGQRMPIGGPFLADAELDVVRTWVASGAPR
jgi:hypothetical protein